MSQATTEDEIYSDGEMILKNLDERENSHIIIDSAEENSDGTITLTGENSLTGEKYEQRYTHGVNSHLKDNLPSIELLYEYTGFDIDEGEKIIGSKVTPIVFNEDFCWTTIIENPREKINKDNTYLSTLTELSPFLFFLSVLGLLVVSIRLTSSQSGVTSILSFFSVIFLFSVVGLYYRYKNSKSKNNISFEYVNKMTKLDVNDKIVMEMSDDIFYGIITDTNSEFAKVKLEDNETYKLTTHFNKIESDDEESDCANYESLWIVDHPYI